MKSDSDAELAPHLAKARILMFEYDADGVLTKAIGSCLGGGDPHLEVRSGLVSPETVRRTVAGASVIERVTVAGRTLAVRHQPVRGAGGEVERVLATAIDVTHLAGGSDPIPLWLAAISAAS